MLTRLPSNNAARSSRHLKTAEIYHSEKLLSVGRQRLQTSRPNSQRNQFTVAVSNLQISGQKNDTRKTHARFYSRALNIVGRKLENHEHSNVEMCL